jgi:hypothetical protein
VGKQAVRSGEKITVGFVDKAAVMKRVRDAKAHSDIRAVAGIYKVELVMSDSSVV